MKAVWIEEQGIQVVVAEQGESPMCGRRVKGVRTPGGSATAREDEAWIVVNEFHGDRDVDWIVMLCGGFETGRVRVEACTEIVWALPVA